MIPDNPSNRHKAKEREKSFGFCSFRRVSRSFAVAMTLLFFVIIPLTVMAAPTPPVANDDADIATDEDVSVVISPLDNDTEGDGGTLSIDSITSPMTGTAVISGTQVVYTPTLNFNGVDTLTYVATDGSQSDTATITLTVAPINDAPQVVNEGALFEDKWGSYGSGDGEFNWTPDVAVDSSGNVYVADYYNNRIQKFDSSGNFVTKWGSSGSGDGQFTWSYGIAVDGSGNVYVSDHGNHRIQKFDSSGEFVAKWGSSGSGDGQFSGPIGIAVDGSGNVYVADYYNNRIQKFDSSGTFLTKWGSSGSGDGEFNYLWDIESDSSGNVYVADYGNHRIQKFDSSGNFVTKWGSSGSGDGEFSSPYGIAVDSSGKIYILDAGNYRIQIFDSSGNYLTEWGSSGSGDGQFSWAFGIDIDSNGNVYVADSNNNRIQKFSLGGPIDEVFVTMSEDGDPTAFDLTLTGADVENDSMSWSLLSQASNGAAAIGTTGATTVTIDYSPTANYNGYDSFEVKVSDGELTGTVTVSVTIESVNDTPVASDDTVATDEDTAVPIDVLENDNDPVEQDTLSIDSITQPMTGTAVVSGTQVVYTPALNFNGIDVFTYVASDGVLTDTATVTVTVAPVNDAPDIVEDNAGFLKKWGKNGGDGSDGTEDGEFHYSNGIAVDLDGNLYVVSSYNNRIQKFDNNGQHLATWGSYGSGNGEFDGPYGIAIDSSGNIYVADTENDRIQKFASDGQHLATWGSEGNGNGEFDGPYGIAVDGNGNIYVADHHNSRIQKLDSTGQHLATWGSQGSGNGEFDAPADVSIDASGNVYVVDKSNHRIQKLDSGGNFVTTWGSEGSNNGQFNYPRGVAVDRSGYVYVADCSNNRIQKFDSNGTYITKFGKNNGDGTSGTGNGEFDCPTGVAVDTSGNVFVADGNNHRIQKLRLDGPINDTFVTMSEDGDPTAFGLTLTSADADEDSLTWSISTQASNGTASIGATTASTATIDYSPTANYNGSDSFEVMVSDDELTATVTVSVTIEPVVDEPVAVADNTDVDEDSSVIISPLDNDENPDEMAWMLESITQPLTGTAVISGNQVVYTPTANFHGMVSLSYVATTDAPVSAASVDAYEPITDSASIAITVNAVNDIPTATDDNHSVTYATALSVPADGILANDSDIDDDALSATLVAGPSKGTLDLSADGSFVYTPTRGLTGADSFTYMANDGTTNSNTATVNLTISAIPDYTLNTTTAGEGSGTVALDPAGGTYADLTTVSLVASAAEGSFFSHWSGDLDNADANTTIRIDGNKSVTANFALVPPVTYTLSINVVGDGTATPALSPVVGSDGLPSLKQSYVEGSQVSLTAVADEGWQFDGWSGSITSSDDNTTITMDGDKTVTASFSRIPPELTVTIVGNGSVTPASGVRTYGETISLTAVADDGWQFDGWSGHISGDANPIDLIMEGDKSVTATFSEEPEPDTPDTPDTPNNAPVALMDDASTQTGVAIPIDVLANDSDADGDVLTISTISQPANGTATHDGTKIVYTPDVGFTGTDRFTYGISDGRDGSASATVIVKVAKQITAIEVKENQETVLSFENMIEQQEPQAERSVERRVQTTIVVPANAVKQSDNLSDTFALNFVWLEDSGDEDGEDPSADQQEDAIPDGLVVSPLRFVIDAIVNSVLDPDYEFDEPIVMTLVYDEELLANLIEETLQVRYWDIYEEAWKVEGVRIIEHDRENNRIVIEIAHLTEFAIFAQPQEPTSLDEINEPSLQLLPQLYLPMIQ